MLQTSYLLVKADKTVRLRKLGWLCERLITNRRSLNTQSNIEDCLFISPSVSIITIRSTEIIMRYLTEIDH